MDIEEEKHCGVKRNYQQYEGADEARDRKTFRNNMYSAHKETFVFSYQKDHSMFVGPKDLQELKTLDLEGDRKTARVTLAKSKALLPLARMSDAEALAFLDDWVRPHKKPDNRKLKSISGRGAAREAIRRKKAYEQEVLIKLALTDKRFNKKLACQQLGIKYSSLMNLINKQKRRPARVLKRRFYGFLTNQRYLAFLEDFLSRPENGASTLGLIRLKFLQHFKGEVEHVSFQTIGRMLKRISFTKKRAGKYLMKRNSPVNLQERKDKALTFLENLKAGHNIIAIDETGINSQLVPVYIWARKGKKVVLNVPPRTTNTSVLAAVSLKGICGFQLFNGAVTALDFGAFICSLINSHPTIKQNLDRTVFFMDNARIHKA